MDVKHLDRGKRCRREFLPERSRITGLFVLFLTTAVVLPESVSNAPPHQRKQALGELKIEGKYVERLVLCRKNGRTEQFNEPNETINLAVGEYRLQEVRLKGGYICNSLRSSTTNWIAVTESESAVLKVGAPLKWISTRKCRYGRDL
jgi:hypothetical protein